MWGPKRPKLYLVLSQIFKLLILMIVTYLEAKVVSVEHGLSVQLKDVFLLMVLHVNITVPVGLHLPNHRGDLLT